MNIPLDQISQLLLDYRYLILFPLVVIEGPIVTVAAGFFIALGNLNAYIVYALVVTGDLAGDFIYYFLGRLGQGGPIERWGKFIGLNVDRVRRLENHFKDNGGKTILIGKLSHGIGGAFLAAAGLAKMRWQSFLWYNFLGTVPKSLVLLVIGFYFGQALFRINRILEATAILFLILVAAIVIYHFRQTEKKPNNGLNGK